MFWAPWGEEGARGQGHMTLTGGRAGDPSQAWLCHPTHVPENLSLHFLCAKWG